MSYVSAVVIAAFIKGFPTLKLGENEQKFALVHPEWFSFPAEKRVRRLFGNLGAVVVVYVICVWSRPARKEICKFTFCRLESGREVIVDSGLFYVLFPLYTRLSKTQLN